MKIDLAQLDYYDDDLKSILIDTEEQIGFELTLTSQMRFDDPGVHGEPEKGRKLRGTDASCRDRVIGKRIEVIVNLRWIYDPKRPNKKCCLYHKIKNGEYHLHFQSHPNTIMR